MARNSSAPSPEPSRSRPSSSSKSSARSGHRASPPPAPTAAKGPETPAGTQAISRALAVLRMLIEADDDVQVSEIVNRLHLTPGTAHRIVGALAAEGFLTRNPATDGFYLGSTAILLGQAAQRALGADRALPLLKQLNAETNESVNLAVRDGAESLVIMRVQSTLPLRFEQHPGARFPLYSTASGKAMMSFAKPADTYTYLEALPAKLPPVTPHTLATPADLAAELARTRTRGYSIDNEENVEGVRCIGAPVLDAQGHAHAAVVLQVPAIRLPDTRIEELAPRLLEVAAQVAQVIPADRTMQPNHSPFGDGGAE